MNDKRVETLKEELKNATEKYVEVAQNRPRPSDEEKFRAWEFSLRDADDAIWKVKQKIQNAGLYDYFADNDWFCE